MKLLYVLLVLVIAVNAVPIDEHLNDNEFKGTKWVVLVAGAPGWGDYASQSSVYHAYQVVHANGIPDENIIVFHPDDIANNSLNPTPGKIIDHPCGDDVYHGVPKDYTGNDVNPTTFINVLKGSQELASKGKKVLNSGPNDHVFIYFLDHGADEIILFQRKYLHAKDLNDALIEMHQNKRFGKLVFYLEACESGSMFNKLLPKDINVYAITSSTPTKMSGKMYPDKYYHTTIGSFFAHYWLLNDEQADLNKETLQQQFDYIYKWTNTPGQVDAENFTQQAQQYGDVSIAKLPVSDFIGARKSDSIIPSRVNLEMRVNMHVVSDRDVPVYMLEANIENANNDADRQKYTEELKSLLNERQYVDKHMTEYVNSIQHLLTVDSNAILNTKQELNNRECYRKLVVNSHDNCFNMNQNPYVLGKLYIFVNICEEMRESSDADINAVNQLLIQYCQQSVEHKYSQIIE